MAAIRDAASSVRPHPLRAQAPASSSWSRRQARHARLAIAAAAVLPLLSAPLAHADPLYWDINGTAANSGTTAAGTWDATTANWNTDLTGGAAGTVGSWVSGSTAVFSSGTGHTGTFNVTIAGTQSVGGIVFEEGSAMLTGTGALDFGSNAFTIQTTHTGNNSGNILVPILGSGDLTISNTSGGDATINVDGSMTGFTGNIIVGPGTDAGHLTKLQLDGLTGNPAKTITLNSFSELSNNNQVTLGDGTLTSTNYTIANPIVLAGSNAWIAGANGPAGQQKIVTYAGAITGSGNLWIGIGNGGGRATVVLGAQSSYSGDTYVVMANNNGLVQLGIDNALPATTNLIFGSGTAGQNPAVGPFDFNGHNLTVASLSSSTTGAVQGLFNTSSTPVTLTLNGAKDATFKGVIGNTNTNINPFNDNAPYKGVVSTYANISLVKNGAATQTLSAAGNTIPSVTINGGTLAFTSTNAVNGALIGPSTVTVGPAGTLATGPGNVTLNASITAAGAVAPGGNGTVGNMVLSGGDLTFNDGSSLTIDFLNSASYDTITSNANINLDSGSHTFDLNLATGGTLTPGTYHIATANNVSWDGINGFTVGSTPSSAYNYSLIPDGPYLDLMITPNSPVYRWSLGGSNPPVEGGGDWSDGSGNFIDLSTGNPATWSNSNPVDVIVGGDNVNGIGDVIHLTSNVVINGKLTLSPVIEGFPYTIGDGSPNTLTLSPAANTIGIHADTSATINAPVTLATSQTWTVAGSSNLLLVNQPVSGAGNTLTKNGPGIVILAAPGGSLGALNVTQGALLVRDPSAIGTTTPVSLDTNGAFGLDASISVANPITVGTGGGTLVVSGTNTGTMTGAINATGPVTKSGSGVLVLTNAANTIPSLILKGFSGTDPSYVAVDSPAPLGSGPITLNGGGIRALASMTIPNDFTLTGRGTGAPGASNPGAGDFDRMDTGANDVTLTGVLSGNGDMIKYGSGSLTLSGANTVAGGAFYIRENSTIVANSASAFGSNNIALHSDATISTPTVDVLASTIRGGDGVVATLHKTGAATLILGAVGSAPGSGGVNTPGSTAVIDQGAIQLNSVGGLGGNATNDYMNIVVNPGTELIAHYAGGGDRVGGSLTLAGGTVTLSATTPFAGNGEANLLQAYTQTTTAGVITSTNHGNALNVTASSTIRSFAQSTDNTTRLLAFQGPVNISTGATLTVDNENTGGFDNNNLIAFRGSPDVTAAPDATHFNAAFPNDALTLAPGATFVTTGTGQTRLGRAGSQGKIIVGQGTPGSDSVVRFGANTFLNDSGGTNGITRFIVSGSGNAGLRVEAAMNSTYRATGDTDPTHHEGSTGLFGKATNGSHYTVLSNNRVANLSAPYGSPALPVGGTLTVAATDATDVVGAPLTAGPAAPVGLTLAFDNTSSSANANLTYQLSADLVNFAHVQAQKTNAGTGSVKLQLAGGSRVADLVLLNSTTLDLVDHGLVVESSGPIATYLSNNQLFSSAVNADTNGISTIVQLSGSDDFLLTGSDTTTFNGLTLDAFSLLLQPAYYGDVNLDGRINADDYALMDRSVAKGLNASWFHGDFNNDNAVDAGDYFLLDRSYAITHGNALSPSLLAQREAQFGDTYVNSLLASVPEPGTLSLLSLGVLPLLGRRRRSTR